MITQKSRWDDAGSEPGAGAAKYVAGDQPIAEYDNWFNNAAVDDINGINKRFYDALYPEEQGTPNMTLSINAGNVYFNNTILKYAGGNTPSFVAPTVNPRIDIVTLNSSGTLAITQGTEAASPSPPAYPDDKIVICEVYNRVGETSIKTDDDSTNGYIYKDVRPFVIYNSANQIGSPTQPSRAVNTIYQNTNSRNLFVLISAYITTGNTAILKIGSASPPTTIIHTGNSTADTRPYFFIVPPNWYYKFESDGSPTINSWTEW